MSSGDSGPTGSVVSREELWIAMSDLWLDTELEDDTLERLAERVRLSGLDRAELEAVFVHELSGFLGGNHLCAAGEWSGFDPDWVCEQAGRLRERRLMLTPWRLRLERWVSGFSTHAARPTWRRVLTLAFGSADAEPS